MTNTIVRSLLNENVPESKIVEMTGMRRDDIEKTHEILDEEYWFVNELEHNEESTDWFV